MNPRPSYSTDVTDTEWELIRPYVPEAKPGGRPEAGDEEMLELLEPYRGQRWRALRLIEASGVGAPRYGPRLEVTDHAKI